MNLHGDLAAFIVRRLSHFREPRNKAVIVGANLARAHNTIGMNAGDLRDDQAGLPFGPARHVGQILIADRSIFSSQVCPHGRHNHSIGKFHRPYF